VSSDKLGLGLAFVGRREWCLPAWPARLCGGRQVDIGVTNL
jgi:hypothetical protein